MELEELKMVGCSTIDELITEDFGEIGTPERTEFERSCDSFIIDSKILSFE